MQHICSLVRWERRDYTTKLQDILSETNSYMAMIESRQKGISNTAHPAGVPQA